MSNLDGLLILDKPTGPTSHDLVDEVRRRLGTRSVGHTGSLDPNASGVLVICVGAALRIAEYLEPHDKAYDAVLLLGRRTDTLDVTGRVLAERPVPPLDPAAVEAAFARFRGPIMQVPPMYSSVKIGGRKLLDLARAGRTVERPPRAVEVRVLELVRLEPPRIAFRVACSKGTYVRTLCDDLGRALGCGAALESLRRTRAGPYTLADAVPVERVTPGSAPALLVPPGRALAHLPAVTVAAPARTAFLHGQALRADQVESDLAAVAAAAPGAQVRVLDPAGLLLGIGLIEATAPGRAARLRPRKVLAGPPGRDSLDPPPEAV